MCCRRAARRRAHLRRSSPIACPHRAAATVTRPLPNSPCATSPHGPATGRDLAYWATLTMTDIRRGSTALPTSSHRSSTTDASFWHAPGDALGISIAHRPPAAGTRRDVPGVSGLTLDDRRRGCSAASAESATGMALVDAQLVAAMRRTVNSKAVTFSVRPHRALHAHEPEAT